MEIGVRVEAENPLSQQRYHTASAYLTFVALDESGKPVHVNALIPESEQDKKRMKAAEERRRLRLEKRELLKKYKR